MMEIWVIMMLSFTTCPNTKGNNRLHLTKFTQREEIDQKKVANNWISTINKKEYSTSEEIGIYWFSVTW